MHGNIWEWCWDWHGPYGQGNATDPTGPASGSSRIIRGGVWHYKPAYVRCALRYKNRLGISLDCTFNGADAINGKEVDHKTWRVSENPWTSAKLPGDPLVVTDGKSVRTDDFHQWKIADSK